MGDGTPEERARKLVGVAIAYWQFDDPEFEDNYALDIATEIRAAVQAERQKREAAEAKLEDQIRTTECYSQSLTEAEDEIKRLQQESGQNPGQSGKK